MLSLLAAIPLLTAGCSGGGGGASARAASPLQIAMDWGRSAASANSATVTRAVSLPTAANSVTIAVRDSKGYTDSRTLNRPTQTTQTEVVAEFFALADGTANISAFAYTGANGTGETVAQATVTTVLRLQQTSRPTLNFGATYSQLRLLQNGQLVGATVDVTQDGTITLAVRGETASGIVTKTDIAGTWSSANPGIATVTPAGVVTGIVPGTVAVTFTDTTGQSAALTIAVRGGSANVELQ